MHATSSYCLLLFVVVDVVVDVVDVVDVVVDVVDVFCSVV